MTSNGLIAPNTLSADRLIPLKRDTRTASDFDMWVQLEELRPREFVEDVFMSGESNREVVLTNDLDSGEWFIRIVGYPTGEAYTIKTYKVCGKLTLNEDGFLVGENHKYALSKDENELVSIVPG